MSHPLFQSSSLLKSAFGFALVLVALVGFAHAGAAPAEAAFCPPIAGCVFSHIQQSEPPYWEPTCCIYDCPWGQQEPLYCFE